MATIDLATEGAAGKHPTMGGNVNYAYRVEYEINLATAVTSKGTALASADVIQCIPVPANTLILDAGLICKTAMTGTSTDATIDFGITGVDADQFVDGWDLDAAVAGGVPGVRGVGLGAIVTTADTIDMLIATQTGTILTGKVRAWAVLVSLGELNKPGLAALAS